MEFHVKSFMTMYNNWVAISIILGLHHLKFLVEHSPTQTQIDLNEVISITTYIFGCSRFVCEFRLSFLFVSWCFDAAFHPWRLHYLTASNNSRVSAQVPLAAETARNYCRIFVDTQLLGLRPLDGHWKMKLNFIWGQLLGLRPLDGHWKMKLNFIWGQLN